ncbi:MAG: response regulator [Ferruginibacter sp.]
MKLKKILLIEDDKDDQYLFTEALDSIALSAYCKAVNNGQEALHHLQRLADYQMIFLDLNMPVMNGLECLKQLKADNKFNDIPVVIITTSNNPVELQDCLNLGVKTIFHKPSSFPELCDGLNNILMN